MTNIITFAQQKGGAGKTTVLVQLAVAWAAQGHTVGLVDLDPQGSLKRWADMRDDFQCTASADWKAAGDIRSMASAHDLVLVDCPGNADILLRATIRDSDLVIAPCQPSAMDIWALDPVIEMASKEKTPLFVVLNRVPPQGQAGTQARTDISAPLLTAQLGNRVGFPQAFAQGKAASEVSKSSRAAGEATVLAAEILRKL